MKDNTLDKILFAIMAIAISLSLSHCSMDGLQETDPVLNDAMAQETIASDAFNQENGSVTSSDQNQILAEIKMSTAKYHRIEAALEDGYVMEEHPHCVSNPLGPGAMGIHITKPVFLFDGEVNPSEPEALVYEPMKNGKFRLVAIEFIVSAKHWEGIGIPMLGNKEFDDHTAEGSPGPPFPHYQLHTWVWKNNPSGMYAQFNPNVTCEYSHGEEE